MSRGLVALAVVPAASVALGAWLLDGVVARRREYERLLWKAGLPSSFARGSVAVWSCVSF